MAMHNNRTFFNGKSNFLQVALFFINKKFVYYNYNKTICKKWRKL